MNPVMAALDTDKDGTISATEIAAANVSLKVLDKNGDGKVTTDEMRPAPQPMANPTPDIVERLMEFDRNGDKKLTAAELPARMKPLLAQADTDKDGVLTAAELSAYVEKQEAERIKAEQEAQKRQAAQPGFPGEPGREGPRDGRPGGPGGPGGMRMSPIAAALDTDKDGILSAEEIAAAPTTLKTLDKNGDGVLTPDELRPAGFGGERGPEGERPRREGERP